MTTTGGGGLQWLDHVTFWESCVLILGFGILLRLGVGTYPYSGAGKPPMFGDYEAQRHWMEITVNLPATEWYTNSSLNDLQYWGLDYPPLSAYQSWIVGVVARETNPELVALGTSRGIESYSTKLFMRWSVIASDMLFFLPAAVCFIVTFYPRSDIHADRPSVKDAQSRGTPRVTRASQLWALAVLVLQPSIMLIDHGHFQYNCISLGLTLSAATLILRRRTLLGSACFCAALNHKQMSLYYAPAFFAHLLGRSLQSATIPRSLLKITRLGATVLASFAILWYPYLGSLDAALAVLGRILPFDRGLYEDYVSNFWCVSSLVVKWRRLLPLGSLTRLCAAATILAAIPSMAHQIRHPSRTGFLYALTNSAFAFYLFSFQVHEKSILLPLLPAVMLALHEPLLALWVSGVAAFSMLPLLERDGLAVPYAATLLIFFSMLATSRPLSGTSTWLPSQATEGGEEPPPWIKGTPVKGSHNQSQGGRAGHLNLGAAVPLVIREDREALVPDQGHNEGGTAHGSHALRPASRDVPGSCAGGAVSELAGGAGGGSGGSQVAPRSTTTTLLRMGVVLSIVGTLTLHAASIILPPPPSLPWLFPALESAFSFAHFAVFTAYTNWRQWQLPGDQWSEAAKPGRDTSVGGFGGSARDGVMDPLKSKWD